MNLSHYSPLSTRHSPLLEELVMQVHAAAGNDRLDEHGLPGRQRDIDRKKPRRSDTISICRNVVSGRVLAPFAEREHSGVDRNGIAAFVPEHDGNADRCLHGCAISSDHERSSLGSSRDH
jgi:hypothetical protein